MPALAVLMAGFMYYGSAQPANAPSVGDTTISRQSIPSMLISGVGDAAKATSVYYGGNQFLKYTAQNPQEAINIAIGATSAVASKAISNYKSGESSSLESYIVTAAGGGLSYLAGQGKYSVSGVVGVNYLAGIGVDLAESKPIQWVDNAYNALISGATTKTLNSLPQVRGRVAQSISTALKSARTEFNLKTEVISIGIEQGADMVKSGFNTSIDYIKNKLK